MNEQNQAIEMVFVQGGTLTMKSGKIETLSDYHIGKYPVTQAQWSAVMGKNPSHFPGCDNCPVDNVSYNDIQNFIQKLNHETGKNYRLPTEAEWEYAAKGGNQSKNYEYAGSNEIDLVAWYERNSGDKKNPVWLRSELNIDEFWLEDEFGRKTHPVGQKAPNELGIYDMSGNVWEWCNSWFDEKCADKVVRGGCWGSDPNFCSASFRNYTAPDLCGSHSGFRLAL